MTSADLVEQVLCKCGIDLLVRAPHDFVRSLSLADKLSLFRFGLGVSGFGLRRPRAFLELLKFLEPATQSIVNTRRMSDELLLSARCDVKVAASRVPDQARLSQVGLGPQCTRFAKTVCLPDGRSSARSSGLRPN